MFRCLSLPQTAPLDGGVSLAEVWNGDLLMVTEYILSRLEAAEGNLEQVTLTRFASPPVGRMACGISLSYIGARN